MTGRYSGRRSAKKIIMRSFILFLPFFFGYALGAAQDIGLSAGYQYVEAHYWDAIVRDVNRNDNLEQPFLEHSFVVGLDMGFSLSNHLRLLPELNYTYLASQSPSLRLQQHHLGALLNLNIYPFGFGTQLHCPTFSKIPYGRSPQSGIFFQVAAGASLVLVQNTPVSPAVSAPYQPQAVSPKLGLGAGYDIIFRERLSVSPMLNAYVLPLVAITDYDLATAGRTVLNLSDNDAVWLFRAGLRIAYIFE